ncbi:MAG: hypothetical protein NTW19_02420 [Planctomycetota bacterium]|nr:hypothetical protein [Planctomycetota bacterium]
MNILLGLFDHMVLQRSDRNASDASFSGECSVAGKLVAKITRKGKKVKGFVDVQVGKARDGKLTGKLVGLPTGGPYHLKLAIVNKKGEVLDKLEVKDVLVGDVWVAAGQSNMQGVGITTDAPGTHPSIRAFYMDDHWAVAKDAIHQLHIAVDPVHNGGNRATEPGINPRGAGPAISFAREMLKTTGVPQGIIVSAHGGTSMSQWDPALKDQGGKSLYGANLRRCIKNGGRVRGVIWYQGESDANDDAAKVFTDRMKGLVSAFRRDLKDPRLPVVTVQIGRVVLAGGWAGQAWNSIQDQQRLFPEHVKNVSVVPAIDLELDDLIHIAGCDQEPLGIRLAYAMRVLIEGKKAGKPPISLRKVTSRPGPHTVNEEIVLEFDNVAGALVAKGRPSGFTIGDPLDGRHVYRTKLEGNKVILQTSIPGGGLVGKWVSYGQGLDPYCNITDRKGRGLLVMGPIAVGAGRALSQFVQSWSVTQPLPGRGKLEEVTYPTDLSGLPWRDLKFDAHFANLHPELEKLGMVDHLVYYRCRIECPEEMSLIAQLGYDGPVKLWIDGEEKFHDPNGTNPASVDQKGVKFTASAGSHDVVIALGTNGNKAWGVYLRFERAGLSQKQLKIGPTAYAMPTVHAK